jgi:hypothetical protein
MGSYRERLDEVLVRPPYALGTAAGPYQCHIFPMNADIAKLERITNTYLNDPLGQKAGVRFEPLRGEIWVSFNLYGRAESRHPVDKDKGWLAYTEVILAYFVVEKTGSKVADVNVHLPFVFIAPATPADAGAFPVLLGRECFGFAKNPGRVAYAPARDGTLRQAILEIYDWSDAHDDRRLHLRPALAFEAARRTADGAMDEDDFYASFIRRAIGDTLLLDPQPWRNVRSGERFEIEARGLTIGRSGESVDRIRLVKDAFMLADLVALKQFRDAKSCDLACHNSVVKTRIYGPTKRSEFRDATVRFEDLSRVEMWSELGCAKREQALDGYYHIGEMTYAEPKATKIWNPRGGPSGGGGAPPRFLRRMGTMISRLTR